MINMSEWRNITLRVLENSLLVGALLFMVPSVPSDISTSTDFSQRDL